MISGKDNILRFIRFNETPFWMLRRSEKSEPLADSGDRPLTIDESVARLQQFFEILGPGTYFIESWGTENQKKMRCKDTIQVLPESVKDAMINSYMPHPETDIDARINRALNDYKTEVELRELREENARLKREKAELESGIESSMGRIFNKVEPYLGMIMGTNKIASPTPVIGGSVDAEQKRLEKAFEIWQVNEPEPIFLIEKIAQLSQKDKSTYQMARNMLINT